MKQKMKHRGVHNPRPPVVGVRPEELETRLHGAPLTDSSRPKADPPLSAGAIEARRLIAEAQLKYTQQQEKAMQAVTAQNERVQAALKEWEDESLSTETPAPNPKERHYFKATVGVSQAAFNYVGDNPYTTTIQAIAALEQQGFKKSSLSSLYTQMVRQGQLSRDKDGKLTALIPEFRPLKASATVRNLGLALRKKLDKAPKKAPTKADPPPQEPVQRKQVIITRHSASAGIATLNAVPAQAAPAQPPTPKLLTAAQVLETLSIKEAHILYRELQTMFG